MFSGKQEMVPWMLEIHVKETLPIYKYFKKIMKSNYTRLQEVYILGIMSHIKQFLKIISNTHLVSLRTYS